MGDWDYDDDSIGDSIGSGGSSADETPLIEAVQNGDLQLVHDLLIEGDDVNGRIYEKATPLHYACENSRLEVARLFLQYGANVNAEDNTGRTPLYYVGGRENAPEIVQLLIDNGADLDAKDDGLTAFFEALKKENVDMAKLLMENGSDVNTTDRSGETPLEHACWYDRLDLIWLLVRFSPQLIAENF